MKQQICQNGSGVRTARILVVYREGTMSTAYYRHFPTHLLKLCSFTAFPPALIHACHTRYASAPLSAVIVTLILNLCLPDELYSSLDLSAFQNPNTQHNALSTGSIVTTLSGQKIG